MREWAVLSFYLLQLVLEQDVRRDEEYTISRYYRALRLAYDPRSACPPVPFTHQMELRTETWWEKRIERGMGA